MMTIDDMYNAITAAVQRAEQSQNTADLMELQMLAGYLMRPAESVGDGETARRFQLLAAKTANIREDIMKQRGED